MITARQQPNLLVWRKIQRKNDRAEEAKRRDCSWRHKIMPGTKGKGRAEKAYEILCKEGDVWRKKRVRSKALVRGRTSSDGATLFLPLF